MSDAAVSPRRNKKRKGRSSTNNTLSNLTSTTTNTNNNDSITNNTNSSNSNNNINNTNFTNNDNDDLPSPTSSSPPSSSSYVPPSSLHSSSPPSSPPSTSPSTSPSMSPRSSIQLSNILLPNLPSVNVNQRQGRRRDEDGTATTTAMTTGMTTTITTAMTTTTKLSNSSSSYAYSFAYAEAEEVEQFPKIIELNVGGVYFATTKETLTRFPDSMLGVMFSGRFKTEKDHNGRYFIDRDGAAFGVILNYLRTNKIFFGPVERELVYHEAEYYRIAFTETWEDENLDDINVDLGTEKTIISYLRSSTLSPWNNIAKETLRKNIPAIVSVLAHNVHQTGSFGASVALYQNEKKKNTLSTSWKTEGPGSETGIAWCEIIVYLEKVGQPLVELWCAYLKKQGFQNIKYTKRTYPVLHWCIVLHWHMSHLENIRLDEKAEK